MKVNENNKIVIEFTTKQCSKLLNFLLDAGFYNLELSEQCYSDYSKEKYLLLTKESKELYEYVRNSMLKRK